MIDACLVERLSDSEANQRLSSHGFPGITRNFDVKKAHTSWKNQKEADMKQQGDLRFTWSEQAQNDYYHDTCSVCMATGFNHPPIPPLNPHRFRELTRHALPELPVYFFRMLDRFCSLTMNRMFNKNCYHNRERCVPMSNRWNMAIMHDLAFQSEAVLT